MEGFPIDYHILFIGMAFILMIITVFLLFVDNTKEKTIAAMLFAGINYIFCIVNSMGFFAIDFYGFTTNGILVHNPSAGLFRLFAIFFLLVFVNIALLFYCWYLWVNEWKIEAPTYS